MKQSRRMSLVESVANVAVGYGVALATQIVVFPWFGLSVTLAQNAAIGVIFSLVSVARSYLLRRAFEALRVRQLSGNSG
jgi:hypothetical protein